jgi:hypothetical protein
MTKDDKLIESMFDEVIETSIKPNGEVEVKLVSPSAEEVESAVADFVRSWREFRILDPLRYGDAGWWDSHSSNRRNRRNDDWATGTLEMLRNELAILRGSWTWIKNYAARTDENCVIVGRTRSGVTHYGDSFELSPEFLECLVIE